MIDEFDFKLETEDELLDILREGIALGDADIPYEAYLSSGE